jgi:uncharacterized membrane protein YhaH (DUF805 family)
MQFIKKFLINLLVIVGIGVVLFFLFPDIMKQIFQLYGAIFGPIIFLVIIVAALPRKHRSR